MKKIMSLLLLCVLFVLSLFAGCSKVQTGFVILSQAIAIDNYSDCYVGMNDKMAVIFSTSVEFSQDPELNESDLTNCEPELEKVDEMITLFDINKNKIIAQKQFTEKEYPNVMSVGFQDEDTIIFKGYESKATLYDLKLNKLETINYDQEKDILRAIPSDFSDDLNYCSIDGMFQDYNSNFDGYIFSSEPHTIYKTDKKICGDAFACCGKRMISCDVKSEDNSNKPKSATFCVYDFDSNQRLNSYSTDLSAQNLDSFYAYGCMNGEKALIIATKQVLDNTNGNEQGCCEGSYYKTEASFYLWNYMADANPAPFDTEPLTKDSVEKKNNSLVAEISKEKNISISFDFKPSKIPYHDSDLKEEDKYYIDFKINDALRLYDELLTIKDILSRFPDGMISRLGGLKIFMVNYITGAGAYANNTVGDPFLDEYYFVVMGLGSASDLPHELMHCFEAYINFKDNYFFYDEYERLNLVDFSDYYTYFDYSDEHKSDYIKKFVAYDNNYDRACFISDYSTETPLEDKAELFERMFVIGCDEKGWEESKDMINKAPVINKKTKLICKKLRKYFPEIKETPVWEKALKNN